MKGYYGYVRVSTVRQGEHGSSLQEQRAAIEAFATRQQFTITGWFEETETAAKLGRRAFNRMLAEVERGRVAGVIIHKIDRGARNLRDWAHLADLMDRGIEVHFAHDNLDLTTRGGRLAADLQAVVAADYIRNLRDEVKKGLYGRLKQGIYPFSAPRGYLDRGGGKLKEIDPIVGPLVLQAFELYGTGRFSLDQLRIEMAARGLRSNSGSPLSLDAISSVLRNPFYVGMIRIKTTGEHFEGKHQTLVPRALFDRVQAILSGRLYPRVEIHRYLFRRLIKCARCGRSLTGERQKGIVYYRCHDRGCRGVSLREHEIDARLRRTLAALRLSDEDVGDLREMLREEMERENASSGDRLATVKRDLALIEGKLSRLTDAMVEGAIDKSAYDERRAALINQRLDLREQQQAGGNSTFWKSMLERFELGFVALQSYEMGNDDEKREAVQTVSSNLLADGKKLVVSMSQPFDTLLEWTNSGVCGLSQGAVRTLLSKLTDAVAERPLTTSADHRTGASYQS